MYVCVCVCMCVRADVDLDVCVFVCARTRTRVSGGRAFGAISSQPRKQIVNICQKKMGECFAPYDISHEHKS